MSYSRLLQWLAVVAAADWLFARTLSRSAVFMPKPAAVLAGYQGMVTVGHFAANITSLLAMAIIIWMSWRLTRRGWRALPIALVALLIFSLGSVLFAPSAAVSLAYHLVAIAALFMITRPVISSSEGAAQTASVLLPAAAVFASGLHLAAGALTAVVGMGRPLGLGSLAFNVGEALVVASGFAFGWWMWPNRGERWIWAVAAVPTMALASVYVAVPSISGVLAIWSLGLTLFLPWPLYALSLWAFTAAMLIGWKRRHPIGLAIPMLVAGGYASQLSTQLFLSLIALYLLAGKGELTDAEQKETMDTAPAPWIRLRSGWKIEPQ